MIKKVEMFIEIPAEKDFPAVEKGFGSCMGDIICENFPEISTVWGVELKTTLEKF